MALDRKLRHYGLRVFVVLSAVACTMLANRRCRRKKCQTAGNACGMLRREAAPQRTSAYPGLREREEGRAAVLLAGELAREGTPGHAVSVDGGAHAWRFDEQREHLMFAGGGLVLGHLHDERCAELVPGEAHLADRAAKPLGVRGASVASGHEIPAWLEAAAAQVGRALERAEMRDEVVAQVSGERLVVGDTDVGLACILAAAL